MSLGKQLYIIVSFIFVMIFTGNFIISMKNTKEYLQIESTTKAQDTATSLGMSLRSLMKDKKDSEIETIIKAIANRGFYKEIRLEDISFSFSSEELLEKASLDSKIWTTSDIKVSSDLGSIEIIEDDEALFKELDSLNDDLSTETINASTKLEKYTFLPKDKNFKDGLIKINFNAVKEDLVLQKQVSLNLSKILVKISRAEKFDYIPQWFINLFPLTMIEQKSEISDGWNTSSIIYVSANAGDAYAKLYEQAKAALIYAFIAFVISMGFLVFFLQFILKPLKNIESLAINISKGKFSSIEKLPYTTEIKNVALSMNEMSKKIEGMIKKLNNNIHNMSKKISADELTGLELKQTFETDLKHMFMLKTNGYVLSIKMHSLADYAKDNGNEKVDSFIKNFANILKDTNSNMKVEVLAYRFFGSEFAMLVKNCNKDEITILNTYLQKEFENYSKKSNANNIAHIGICNFNPTKSIPQMLLDSNEACETAKQIGPNSAYIMDEQDSSRDMNTWKELIFDIINNLKFSLTYIGDAHTLNEEEPKLVMQEAFTQAFDENNELIQIGTFISLAEKYNKIVDFDKAVIQKVIRYIKQKDISHEISINISQDSIEHSSFNFWLADILNKNKSIAHKLVFSMPSYAVAKDIKRFQVFTSLVHENGAKTLVKRFESKFIPLDTIKDLNLNYIRLSRDYTNEIYKDAGKKVFIESMQDLCTLLNIKIFAENVKANEDYETIKEIDIYASSR